MRMRTLLLHEKLSLSDLRQAVYQAYDVMLDSAKEAGRGPTEGRRTGGECR